MYIRFFLPIVFAVLAFGLTSSLQEAYAGIVSPVNCDTSTEDLGPFFLKDGNSELRIDPCDLDDMDWFVPAAGTDHMAGQELFICEIVEVIESDGFECDEVFSIDDFVVIESFTRDKAGVLNPTLTPPTKLIVEYENTSLGVAIEIIWELIGGLFGSNESTLNETIEIKRTSEGTSTYRFFQETDFDLAGAERIGDGDQDTFVEISSTLGQQKDSTPESGPPMKGTVSVSPPADEVMADVHDNVVDAIKINEELDGTTGPLTGEKDYVFGFSWDFDLSPGGTFTIEKTKQLEPISIPSGPFPASGTIFGAAHTDFTDSSLFTINRSTGAATLVGPIGFDRCSGMDFHPGTLILYATCKRIGDSQLVLITINTSTGAGTEVAPVIQDFRGRVADISFRNSDNTLYAYLPSGNVLGTINTATGVLTEVGGTGVSCRSGCGNGMAFSFDDILFHANQDDLNTLDQTSGSKTFVAEIDYPEFGLPPNGEEDPRINAMDFDPSSGELFVSINVVGEGGSNFFGTLSPNPGEVLVIGDTEDGLDAIAVFPFLARGGNGGNEEPPTIGMNYAGTKLIVPCGVNFDGKCFTITAPYHEEFKLYEMMSGTHTISITMYCAQGVQTCNYVAIGIMPYSESMNGNTTWKIELSKDFEGNLTMVKTDPEGFLGTITYTTSMGDQFWIVSFTIDFKNKDTGPLKFAVQARDDNGEVRNWELNEGVEFKDSDAYPSILTEFEESLEIDSLCLNEDPTYRYSCAFAEIRDQAIQNAEETLRQMLNGEYRFK